MKFLLILLLSINTALAWEVSVVNTKTLRQYQAQFETELEADNWINAQVKNESFGKNEYWSKLTDGSHANSRDIEFTNINGEEESYTEYFFPQEYTVTKVDKSAEIAAKKAKENQIALGKIARQKCEKALDYIAGYNLSSGKTAAQIDQMIVDFANVHTALKNFRPDTAKGLIEQIDNSEYNELKAGLIDILE